MPGIRSRELRLALALLVAAGVCAVRPAGAAGGAPAIGDVAALERVLGEISSLVVSADFQGAIRRAEATRDWAGDVPRSPDGLRARAELEVLLCTAQIALGDRPGALRSMQRAVYVGPLLSLDESTTSPRVVDLFRAARGGGSGSAGGRAR